MLRIQASADFRLHWSADEWQTVNDAGSMSIALASHFVDIPIARDQRAPIRFTFLWTKDGRWEGRDYEVAV
jgi:glucoamylase